MTIPNPDIIFAPVSQENRLEQNKNESEEISQSLKRTPPHNFEAEASLLGAILNNNLAYEKVSDFLRHEHFSDTRHQRIFQACVKLIERSQLVNPITLKDYFSHDDELSEIGGEKYLNDLSNNLVSVINTSDYGQIIYENYLRRQLIHIGEETINDSYHHNLEKEAGDILEEAEDKLFHLGTTGHGERDFITFNKSLSQALKMIESSFQNTGDVIGVDTGLRDLNGKLGGLHPSDLLILAGRPSMGKTALAMNIAFNAAMSCHENRQKKLKEERLTGAVAVFSLEMSSEQLASRLLSQSAKVGSDKMRRGDLSEDDFDKIILASQKINQIPLYIDDTPALAVSALRKKCRRLKRQQGLSLIVIDYLQLLSPPRSFDQTNRVQQLSAITTSLKALAKEFNVPVLALSQLSRAVEQRENKKPLLSDLRESGSIEQDSDVVMFIYREQYYLERSEPTPRSDEDQTKFDKRYAEWKERLDQVHNMAEIIIAKQRHGPVGQVRAFFDGNYTCFADLDHSTYISSSS